MSLNGTKPLVQVGVAGGRGLSSLVYVYEWCSNLSHYTANINLGRIAALLAYCYRLCRTYVDTYLGSKSLLTFLGMIAGWLFKVFLRTRVYDWLDKQGGWVRICTCV